MDELNRLLSERILVLDGAMGTMIQSFGLSEDDFRGKLFKDNPFHLKGCNDVLSLTRPEIITEIHDRYLLAGADIIETNSFNANAISMAEYGLEKHVYDMALASAKLASDAARKMTLKTPDKPRFAAGTIGPSGKTASLSSDVNNPGLREYYYDDFVRIYKEEALGLISGGADIIIIETVFDTLNCKAAISAVETAFRELGTRLPLMISATVDEGGRTLSGQSVEAFLISISHAPMLSIGLNCSFGLEKMYPHLKILSGLAPFFLSCHPNAGLPDGLGRYSHTPEIMAGLVRKAAEDGLLNIVGGCCGTTPEHIRAIASAVKGLSPRHVPAKSADCALSGLDPFVIRQDSLFVNIGERANVAGSKQFASLIREKKYDEALSVTRRQIENGAQVIDVNMDDAMLDSQKEMTAFLNLLASEPDIARVPVMVDSSRWETLEAGMKCLQGKGIVNSISLKEGEEVFRKRAETALSLGAAVIVMAFDEKGQADSFDRKVSICKRAWNILVDKLGYPTGNIIFDPAILAIGTGLEEHNNYASDYIRATAAIKKECPGCRISGGVSNLSFAFRGNNSLREALHAVFLYHAIKAGMDMGIVNAGQLPSYEDIPEDIRTAAEDVILNRRSDATERLIEKAALLKHEARDPHSELAWRKGNAADRIIHSLSKGISDYIESDIKEAVSEFKNPVEIIEGPLMKGMGVVGELFGQGKLFLPQVIKSARVMKKAVEILAPLIENSGTGSAMSKKKAGKILMATVKGDVHDIGKNIVNVVLRCNNFDVIDLGVMVPCEDIIAAVKREKPGIIGLSGLITPSLEEMVNVARAMENENLKIPILIGGATTSQVHTALKITPVYSGPVAHVNDASLSASTASSLLGAGAENAIAVLKEKYREIAAQHKDAEAGKKFLTLPEARKNKSRIDWAATPPVKPAFTGIKVLKDYPLEKLVPHIDWTYFFTLWELKGKYPGILEHPKYGTEAKKLFSDATMLLQDIIKNRSLTANAVFGIFPANTVNDDDILVYSDETRSKTLSVIHTLRRQEMIPGGQNPALADFIAPADSGCRDYIGLFAATAGINADILAASFTAVHDEYRAIMARALADRLAEAFSEHLNDILFRDCWNLPAIKGKIPGIRPAVGYPSLPDHSEKNIIFDILSAENNAGISLTENSAMVPAASICGLCFANEKAQYFTVGEIRRDQLEDYACRKKISVLTAEKLISTIL